MTKLFVAAAAALLVGAHGAAAQEREVTRRTYTFLHDQLVINVIADAPGELQVLRGERGRVEVAARSADGFPGFGLGGNITRELRLTAVGAERVSYLVVVPENVRVTVRLPAGGEASLASRAPSGQYRWPGTHTAQGDGPPETAAEPLLPTLPGGLFLLHSSRWAPGTVDVPDLLSVRSLTVRFEGADFRVAASRPLTLAPGSGDRFELRLSGEPIDVVMYIPRGTAGFVLRSGGMRLLDSVGGRVRALCGGAVIQKPTPAQDWVTFYPASGRLSGCR